MSIRRARTTAVLRRVAFCVASCSVTSAKVTIAYAQSAPQSPVAQPLYEPPQPPLPPESRGVTAARRPWIGPLSAEDVRRRRANVQRHSAPVPPEDPGLIDGWRFASGILVGLLSEAVMVIPVFALNRDHRPVRGAVSAGDVARGYGSAVLSLSAGAIAALFVIDAATGSRSRIWPIFVGVSAGSALCFASAFISPELWHAEKLLFGLSAAFVPLIAGAVTDEVLKHPAEPSSTTAPTTPTPSTPSTTSTPSSARATPSTTRFAVYPSASVGAAGDWSMSLLGRF